MMHRVECDHYREDCGCPCRCHDRCLAAMPLAGPCWRLAGHGGEHRSRRAVEYDRSMVIGYSIRRTH